MKLKKKKKKELPKSDIIHLCHPRYVLLQPLHADLRLLSRPKIPHSHPGKGISYTQELAHISEAHKLSRD